MLVKFRLLGTTGLVLGLAIIASPVLVAPIPAQAAIGINISVNIAPPALPVYVQPPMPEEGYIWVPGYWAYGADGYYWVEGDWELPPDTGLLWTPAYWGWSDGVYLFHAGYWAPQVGFYGDIDYGYGYGGVGYAGGYWEHGHLFYNRSVNNFGAVHVANVFNRTIVNHTNVTRVSFNGGTGGTRARPTGAELAAQRQHHVAPTAHQTHRIEAARSNPALRATAIAAHGNAVPHSTAAVREPAGSTGRFAASRQPLGRAAAEHPTPVVTHPAAAAGRFAPPRPAQTHTTPAVSSHPTAPMARRPATNVGRYAPARPVQTHTIPVVSSHSMAPAAHQPIAAPHPVQTHATPVAPQHPMAPAAHQPAMAPHPSTPVSHRPVAPAPRPSNVQQVHYPQPSRASAPAAHPAAAAPRSAPQHGNDRHGER
jgi:WXXGXW repeat (2 copies)